MKFKVRWIGVHFLRTGIAPDESRDVENLCLAPFGWKKNEYYWGRMKNAISGGLEHGQKMVQKVLSRGSRHRTATAVF